MGIAQRSQNIILLFMNLPYKSLKSRYLLAFLSLSLIFMIALAYITRSRYTKHRAAIVNQSLVYVQKNNYLKRCIDYQFIINKEAVRSCIFLRKADTHSF